MNTKSGFSIIGYTGTDNVSDTFSHGLTKKPDFAIFKNRSRSGDDWIVYHSSQGATKRGKLNLTNAFDSQTSQFNDTEPTSSVFTIGTFDNINKLNNNYIAYIWAEIPGFSKFGSYTGNGNADGPVIITGFRPRWIMTKSSSTGGTGYDWHVYDTARDTYNTASKFLDPNTSQVEQTRSDGANITTMYFDILSNGFKLRNSLASPNQSGQTYIYAAFAEAPTFNLYGAQSNAR